MRHTVIEEDLRRICSSDLPWSAFRGKTVLISGAGGFLPAYLVETLLYLNETVPGQNTQVIALVRSLAKAQRRLDAYRNRQDLRLIAHDVTLPLPEVGHPEFIIHGASPASPGDFGRDPLATVAANVWGTQHLLALAGESRSEGFLFLSSGPVDFIRTARRKGPGALIDLRLFKRKVFPVSALTQFLSNGVAFAGQMLIPFYLVRACGNSPGATGLMLAPLGLGMACSYPSLGALTKRFGLRKVSAGGALLALLATLPFLYFAGHGLILTMLAVTLFCRAAAESLATDPKRR